MEDTNKDLNQSLERLIWDFMDLHGFTNGRKAEITLMGALTMFLIQQGKTQMKDIATAFNVRNSAASDYVDTLEKKGLIKRVRNDKDRREVYIELTKKGQNWIKYSRGITNKYIDARLSKLAPDERRTLISLVNKVFEDETPSEGYRSGEE